MASDHTAINDADLVIAFGGLPERDKIGWTDERVEKLKSLWADGWSAGQIEKELERAFSRSAILGKLHHLGMLANKNSAVTIPRRREPVIRSPLINTLAIADRSKSVEVHPPESQGVALLDLENHHCRYPIGDPQERDFHFCGGPADLEQGRSYCPYHARLAYRLSREAA